LELQGNSNSATSVAFLMQLKYKHHGPLKVIWDNAPAHRGEPIREYQRTLGPALQLVNLPGYSPDFNGDEAIWSWAREEATGNLCLGTGAAVQEREQFPHRTQPPKSRGETALPNSPAIQGRNIPAKIPV
jgi:transposase